MSDAGKNALPKLLDDPKAPEIYAVAATGFFNANGVISITLESARADHTAKSPGPINRVVVGRLVMPAAGAQALAVGLFDFMEKQGFNFKNEPGNPPGGAKK
jgi:hypothetical protein